MTRLDTFSLHAVRDEVVTGRIADGLSLANQDRDAVLDAREGEAFESERLRCRTAVDEAWHRGSVPRLDEVTVEWIRRTMFLSISRETEQHEIASAVSDDFELIAKAAATGRRDAFVLSLWDSYRRGEIPAPIED